MFIEMDKRTRRRGFTLLEITLSVAILAMMTLAIYRFVATNLTVMRVSSEQNMTRSALRRIDESAQRAMAEFADRAGDAQRRAVQIQRPAA